MAAGGTAAAAMAAVGEPTVESVVATVVAGDEREVCGCEVHVCVAYVRVACVRGACEGGVDDVGDAGDAGGAGGGCGIGCRRKNTEHRKNRIFRTRRDRTTCPSARSPNHRTRPGRHRHSH